MTDLQRAVAALPGHALCFCRGDVLLTADGKGIAPLMQFVLGKDPLVDFSAADQIVGKAAALLFVKAGVTHVFGRVMSEGAKAVMTQHGIDCSFETLTAQIINRAGTGLCPMEQTVREIDDPEAAVHALRAKLDALSRMKIKEAGESTHGD